VDKEQPFEMGLNEDQTFGLKAALLTTDYFCLIFFSFFSEVHEDAELP